MVYKPPRTLSEWLGGVGPHARSDAVDTSVEAIPKNISEQMIRVLRGYADGVPRTDHDAYHRVGLTEGVNGARQRCTDLRHADLIDRVPDPMQPPGGGKIIYLRGETPSGKTGFLCTITQKGRDFLEALRLGQVATDGEDG
jgi:hypothetical protein